MNQSFTLSPALVNGIPPQSAHILSLLFTTSYVGSIYLTQTIFLPQRMESLVKNVTDSSVPAIPPISATDDDAEFPMVERHQGPKPGDRDHPDTIRARMRAVGIATAGSVGGVWWVVKVAGNYTLLEAIKPTLRLLGLPSRITLPSNSTSLVLSYILAPTLLLGPLYAVYLDGDLPFQKSSKNRSLSSGLSLTEWRNYVVGPVTEELVFRSTILAVSMLGKLKFRTLVFGTPMWFGVAHAHHALEVFRKNGSTRSAAIQAVAGCVFQLGYTTLFGWFASYLYLRTGSVIPPLASHIFCNLMGIYLPTTAVSRHPTRSTSIYLAYIAGIMGFTVGIRWL